MARQTPRRIQLASTEGAMYHRREVRGGRTLLACRIESATLIRRIAGDLSQLGFGVDVLRVERGDSALCQRQNIFGR
jgi:hypothetical protein